MIKVIPVVFSVLLFSGCSPSAVAANGERIICYTRGGDIIDGLARPNNYKWICYGKNGKSNFSDLPAIPEEL